MSTDGAACTSCGARRLGRSFICVKCNALFDNPTVEQADHPTPAAAGRNFEHEDLPSLAAAGSNTGCTCNPFSACTCATSVDGLGLGEVTLEDAGSSVTGVGEACGQEEGDAPVHLRVLQGLGRTPAGAASSPSASQQQERRVISVTPTKILHLQESDASASEDEGESWASLPWTPTGTSTVKVGAGEPPSPASPSAGGGAGEQQSGAPGADGVDPQGVTQSSLEETASPAPETIPTPPNKNASRTEVPLPQPFSLETSCSLRRRGCTPTPWGYMAAPHDCGWPGTWGLAHDAR